MRIPRIGLSASYLEKDGGWAVTVKSAYPDAILRAGGLPVILPPIGDADVLREAVAGLDGVLLIGGGDIRAERYGLETSPLAKLVHPRREEFDFALVAEALAQNKPVLGICLGCQVLNVHYGGTLYQDLPTEFGGECGCACEKIEHSLDDPEARHDVIVEVDTLLGQIVGAGGLRANSTHHQAVRGVGHGLVEAARSTDGLVEAIEDPARPFVVGVQWHPEDLVHDERHRALFKRFVEVAKSSYQ